MREHVGTTCGEWLLLFPAENIVFIEPVLGQTRFCGWLHRNRATVSEPVLDVRRLLGVPEPRPPQDGAILRWRSTDGARQLTLLVDAVEEIVNCYDSDLIDVPIVPRRLRPLCDQVMNHASGRLRLRVKPDVQLPLALPGERRRYALSLLASWWDGAHFASAGGERAR
ncbi:MAG TPA: hypothetical protein VNO55_33120 [Polyangia bacterium]|nr:hypothetical protein [Polyangia bacterium]